MPRKWGKKQGDIKGVASERLLMEENKPEDWEPPDGRMEGVCVAFENHTRRMQLKFWAYTTK